MTSFEEILAKAAPPETVVPLLVGGKHVARIQELERLITQAEPPQSLADANPATALAQEIRDLQAAMEDSRTDFHLRAMPGKQWNKFKFLEPVRAKDEDIDAYTDRFYAWMCQLVALTCVDPVMTAAQVDQLVDQLPGSSWDALSGAAWGLNSGAVAIPFSGAASGLTPSTGAPSRRRSGSASAPAGSAAKSRPARRRTSTTKPAA